MPRFGHLFFLPVNLSSPLSLSLIPARLVSPTSLIASLLPDLFHLVVVCLCIYSSCVSCVSCQFVFLSLYRNVSALIHIVP